MSGKPTLLLNTDHKRNETRTNVRVHPMTVSGVGFLSASAGKDACTTIAAVVKAGWKPALQWRSKITRHALACYAERKTLDARLRGHDTEGGLGWGEAHPVGGPDICPGLMSGESTLLLNTDHQCNETRTTSGPPNDSLWRGIAERKCRQGCLHHN